jgi:hypothetical protein
MSQNHIPEVSYTLESENNKIKNTGNFQPDA